MWTVRIRNEGGVVEERAFADQDAALAYVWQWTDRMPDVALEALVTGGDASEIWVRVESRDGKARQFVRTLHHP